MESGHLVPSRFGNFLHLYQLVRVACHEVQKGETIEILGLLKGFLNNLSELLVNIYAYNVNIGRAL